MRNLILTLIIWIICFTAITVGVSLTYKWYRQLGENITISFQDVSGLVPNQSKVLYRGVQIGSVTEIELDQKTGIPKITARMSREAMKLIGKDSTFWVVSPELGLGSIQNLSTISTGDYISVHPVAGEPSIVFVGLDESPVDNKFTSGLRIILKAKTASGIEEGTAVMYNDLMIGEVGEMGLAKDGVHVLITVYINDPYVKIVRRDSIFGNISGFHADISLFSGSKITLNSIRTLIKGGIKLITPNFKSPPATNDQVYRMLTRDELVEYEDHKC